MMSFIFVIAEKVVHLDFDFGDRGDRCPLDPYKPCHSTLRFPLLPSIP